MFSTGIDVKLVQVLNILPILVTLAVSSWGIDGKFLQALNILNIFVTETSSADFFDIGITAFRIISLCFIPAAISIILISSFQATGFGLASMMVSIIRQLLVLCPAAFILSRFFGINGVWASFALAECFGLTFSVIFFIHVYKTRIRNLERR